MASGIPYNLSRRPVVDSKLRREGSCPHSPGFTLVELLVVIAIVGVLAALLLPALSRSKARAEALMCLNNTKHLALAWTMYSSDNQDHLAYNVNADPAQGMFAPTGTPNWVNNVMDWSANPANTNLEFVGSSALGPYAGYSASVFHCPSDKALSPVQKASGWSGRVRSVSMNAMVGDPGVPSNGGALPNTQYQQFVKEADFIEPSGIFVFLDEHPDSINDGNFLNSASSFEWAAIPGSYHNGGGSFSFADGHAEIHRWHDDSTIYAPQAGASGNLPILLRQSQNTDFNWVVGHMTAPVGLQ